MENILRIIYDKSLNNKILNQNDIEKLIEYIVINKSLNDYILNIDFQPIRSNNLASYSTYTKIITIYTKTIDKMITNLENNFLSTNNFEKILYKNLSILQVILHEIEHANQQRIAYKDNTLEALVLRLSYLVNNEIYEISPEERLAEIKSFNEIYNLINYLDINLYSISNIIKIDKLKRQLRGYHYKNNNITSPTVDYFTLGNKKTLLEALHLKDNIYDKYTLEDRFKYGFPISLEEYGESMKKTIIFLNNNFNNKIKIK